MPAEAPPEPGAARSLALGAAGLAALLGVVLAGDLLVLYLCWEALGLAGYLAERAAGDDRPAPYAVGHLAGYALLAAALLLARESGGSFALGAVAPAALAGPAPGLLLVAALGRLAQAWSGAGARRGPVRELTAALQTLAAAYLLLRGLALAGGAWPAGWGTALALLGVLLALGGGVALAGAAPGLALRRWGRLDAGLLLVALGVGGPLGVGAAALLVLGETLARLPAALWRDEPAEGAPPSESALAGAGLAVGSLAALPPTPGFVARWLLLEAAWQQGLWLLLAALVLAGVLAARAGVEGLRRAGAAATPETLAQGPGLAPALGLAGPLLALSLVPALPRELVEPAVAAALGPAGAASLARAFPPGADWPALALALFGPGLGLLLQPGRVRAPRRPRRAPAAPATGGVWALVADGGRELGRLSAAAGVWSDRLLDERRAPAVVALAAAAAVGLSALAR